MKIGIIAANGKAGSLITEEAVNRGLNVTAIVRNANKTVAPQSLIKDIFELTTDDLTQFDVVVNAFGEFREEKLHLHQDVMQYLSDLLSHSKTRLLVVGGAGSLFVDDHLKTQLYDTPDFPAMFKPLATSQGKALDELRQRDDVRWTFISPAAEFNADGERTGDYTLAGEKFTLNSKGESTISYADYAIALIDEATSGDHIQERISVVSK
ncbi:NAD(P)-dependent oxidoreductase [Mammaliicoccus sp. Dog046]|uniref:NAD(P)-dependent oxidoreductase n=1 Tax=Mammaliicoccus sp. Dog046 TaxID=3034233 RepID=UPI002B25B6FC|nr:NAD(P)-dependent oxidoreductase [Mammaliicoccus sp. Dog046]WQK85179.1 NAD(P)-dependent oxidoreductase [Mammaliicoccus sp. Dog046]